MSECQMQFLPKHVLENSNALCSEQGGHPFFCHREYLQGEWMQLCNWSIGNIFSWFQVAQLFFQSLKWCSRRLILWPCCCELIACAPLSTAVSARAAVVVVGSLPSSHHGHSPGLSLFSSFDQPTQAGSSSPIKKKQTNFMGNRYNVPGSWLAAASQEICISLTKMFHKEKYQGSPDRLFLPLKSQERLVACCPS